MSTSENLVDVVTEAVQKAGVLALQRMHSIGKIQQKSPKDFVTEVDLAAEQLIIETISSKITDVAFYGEEGGHKGKGRYLFVVDPIDATTNYIRGIPLFDICIAVYEENNLILGVIGCPQINELYVAKKGKGAYLNGIQIRISEIDDISKAIVLYNRSNHPSEIIPSSKKVLASILDQASTLRVFGTGGLDYCFMAAGRVDACITPLAEPFHSAGYLIMEEAGACVTNYDGFPYDLESKTIIAANPALYPQILALVQAARE